MSTYRHEKYENHDTRGERRKSPGDSKRNRERFIRCQGRRHQRRCYVAGRYYDVAHSAPPHDESKSAPQTKQGHLYGDQTQEQNKHRLGLRHGAPESNQDEQTHGVNDCHTVCQAVSRGCVHTLHRCWASQLQTRATYGGTSRNE